MKITIQTNGSFCSKNLQDTFYTHQNIFTRKSNAQFTLSQDHQLSGIMTNEYGTKRREYDSIHIQPMAIPIKPKSRINIPKKHLKSLREQAISGKKNILM